MSITWREQWDAAPTPEEEHAEYVAWIWQQATPSEQRAIVRERITAARERGDARCVACDGKRRASCEVCVGSGYDEPGLRPLTATEEAVSDAAQADERARVLAEDAADRAPFDEQERLLAAYRAAQAEERADAFVWPDEDVPF